MIIDTSILQFCAEKTREIVKDYKDYCVWGAHPEFPRSVDDLEWLIMDRAAVKIFVKALETDVDAPLARAILLKFEDRFEIYMDTRIPEGMVRYARAKEFFQAHLDNEIFKTGDIVDHIKNMLLRESSASRDLDLGHAIVAETLAELAAMEFLFPYAERVNIRASTNGKADFAPLITKYGVPAHLIGYYLTDSMMAALKDSFGE